MCMKIKKTKWNFRDEDIILIHCNLGMENYNIILFPKELIDNCVWIM
jgi:hypothetical protein